MSKLQPVRGTHDLLPEDAARFRALVSRVLGISTQYGYGEIATPVFEFSDVFHRTLGDTSDIVGKETYTFTDRGGESITLRPEFTAGVVRAFISNALTQDLPQKFFYAGAAFRYERPQKGRQRQFHQAGVEWLGADSPLADVEVIALAHHWLSALGLAPHAVLEINTLGDVESRTAYRSALVNYFTQHKSKLSEDSVARLEKNPLRILDSKDEADRALVANAPQMDEHFSATAKEFFARVEEGLSALAIPYKLNSKLVRGLDYYSHTVFEFITTELGAQGTVLAGGRYDGLVKLMGGPDVAGIGFAAGIERLLALMEAAGSLPEAQDAKPIAVIPVEEAQDTAALKLVQQLRAQGKTAELIAKGNVGKRFKRADKIGASHALVLGAEEVAAGKVKLKNMASGEEKSVPLSECIKQL